MRVAIVGSRGWQDPEAVIRYVWNLPFGSVVVSGTEWDPKKRDRPVGVDEVAIQAAKDFGFRYKVHPADWKRLGKRAGFARNVLIVEDAGRVVAFWDGKSRGTAHTIALAQERGLPVEIIRPGVEP